MAESSSRMQFGLKHLLLLVLASCVVMAAISGESLNIAVATIFVSVSAIAISTLIWMSAKNLLEVLSRTIRTRKLGHLSRRFRWLMLDALTATWILIAVGAGNYVLEGHQAGADSLVLASLIFGPGVVGILHFRYRDTSRRTNAAHS